MSEFEPFTMVTSSSHAKVYDDFEEINSAHAYDLNISIQAALRRQYPEFNLTVAPANNVSLLAFAAAGKATAELDITTDSIERSRLFYNGSARSGIPDQLADSRSFAKYHFTWRSEHFILYTVFLGPFVGIYNYILKEPGKGETTISHCAVTDDLIFAVGSFFAVHDENFIYVYDGYWTANRALWAEVQKANWKDVILNEELKKTVTELMQKFFESRENSLVGCSPAKIYRQGYIQRSWCPVEGTLPHISSQLHNDLFSSVVSLFLEWKLMTPFLNSGVSYSMAQREMEKPFPSKVKSPTLAP